VFVVTDGRCKLRTELIEDVAHLGLQP
jgi:hypothetical protein